ncbi:MAG: PAS domain S-box protein [Candidatus Latescibacteria bacterium]|nr:PAS domain S-box protein [Candidatus Latescibacterota bacterium]
MFDNIQQNNQNQSVQLASNDYHDMLMNAPIGAFSSTPDGRFIYVNSAFTRIFGYDSPREMIESIKDIGKQLYANPENREEIKRYLEKNDERLNYEFRFIRKDGSVFWGSYNVRTVRDEKGNIVYYQGFLSDVTERKRERESLLKTQFAIDRASDSILWVDDEGYIVYANDSACTSMGYTREELLKMTVLISIRISLLKIGNNIKKMYGVWEP